MTFTFKTRDTPLLQQTLPYEATVSLGEELKAVWGMPQLSSLAVTQRKLWLASDDGDTLEVDVLKERYGDLLDIERPMTDAEAKLLYKGKRSEAIRQNILARGNSGGLGMAAKFGVAFLDVATDPLEVAIGLSTALMFPATGGTLGVRATKAFGEALAASAAAEVAYYGMSKQQQLDYTMNEALLNVSLGTLLGGGIGTVLAPRIRTARDGEVIPTTREQELAKVALNQFVNDDAVNLAPFFRDLRGSTSLTSVRGVQFQPDYTRDLSLPMTRAPLTTAVMGPDGTPFRYKTTQKAGRVAAQVGGTVSRTPDGTYNVRQPIEGDFVRDPVGRPVTFKTERAASKFIASARKGLLPEDAMVVDLSQPGQPSFAVAGGLSPERLAEIESGRADLQIPQGVNTREMELVSDPEQMLTDAVRSTMTRKGNRAYEELGREYSEAALGKSQTSIDVPHKADAELAEAAEELEAFKLALGEDLAEETTITEVEAAKIRGIKETMACMLGSAA